MDEFTPAALLTFFLNLKLVSKAVLLYETLDILTTVGGLAIFPQIAELNPLLHILGGMASTILVKLLVTGLVVAVLEYIQRWPSLVHLVPFTAALPVAWNLLVILAEVVGALGLITA